MKKALTGAACVMAVVTLVQGTGWAAPINGPNTETIAIHCVNDGVRVIIKPDSGASGWEIDAQGELTGVRYFVTSLNGRFYLGELTTEPTGVDPLFTTASQRGNHTGHEATLMCSGTETFIEEGQSFTGFFDLIVTRQDKGL